MSVLACNLLMAAYEEDENWPEIFVKVSPPLLGGSVRLLLWVECRRGDPLDPQKEKEANGVFSVHLVALGRSGEALSWSCRDPAREQAHREQAEGASFCHMQVYIEDSLGERIWVDSPHCKTFVDNVQTAFNTKMPPKSMLLQGEAGRSGGDLSAGKDARQPDWGEDGVSTCGEGCGHCSLRGAQQRGSGCL